MAERATPVSITRRAEPQGDPAAALGAAAAGTLSHLIEVVDREDRLESGTGRFRQDLAADGESRRRVAEAAVLRMLQMAADPINYRILEVLTRSQAATTEIGRDLGLPRLAVEQRITDLVSAGLATKVFTSGEVSGTEAAGMLVHLVQEAVAAASERLAGA